ncbi:hypothetical protein Nepgr_021573 [Nepenthes gracilis]|uniref:Embryonic flower 2 n=1 Tax=Nepenthes gracilis TaxID=150966 RepID=A0AAD3SZ02_NEPGR|nr:hypothetical protein Nepgr_021573 [Nepenthes gracilis]
MPGIPLVARETTQSRSVDQMCRQGSLVHLSVEEEIAAEESLSIYCKPVELYNILQRRAVRNPLFLQRCLHYKIQAKHHRRIQMAVSLSGTLNDGLQVQSLFPLHIMLARMVFDVHATEYSAVYRLTRERVLTTTCVAEGVKLVQVKFLLPEMNRLAAEAKSGSTFILLISYAKTNLLCQLDTSKDHLDNASFSSHGGRHCLLGKIPMETLFLSWEKSPNLSLGERAEMMSTVDMHPCLLKPGCSDEGDSISFQLRHSSSDMRTFKQVQVLISAEVLGAKEKSPYNLCAYSNNLASSSPHILRLRTGNVIFNYRYYNNKLQRTEVTEDFSCPFCLVKCASFKGLRHHLPSSHDLFNFEFWVTEEYQAVNVSVRTDFWRSEILVDGVDPRQQTFFFCSKRLRRRKQKNLLHTTKYVHPLALASDIPTAVNEFFDKADDAQSSKGGRGHSSSANDSHTTVPDPESIQSVSGHHFVGPSVLQFAKTRKLSIERSDHRNRALLERRQFFHSHRAQPMALEQVLSECDSEDEVDDDVVDLEDRRMLDDFVDVIKDEKHMMHLWNSFVRKQRVLADGHIPWACEAFSRLHGHELVQAPALIWCWRLFMIKLWNHGLLDARTINNCNLVLEQFQNQQLDGA